VRALLITIVLAAGCEDANVAVCAGGEAPYAKMLQLATAPVGDHPFDGGVVVRLRISARIACLRGATRARVTASAGSIGGSPAGTMVLVTLTPTQPAVIGGELQGDFELTLPEGRQSRLQVDVADATLISFFGADGGVL
jgi:hypothetical protein